MNILYKIKRILKKPYIWYRRSQEKTTDNFWRQALELHAYNKHMYQFGEASKKNPNLLFEMPLDSKSIVLDLGGFIGEWTKALIKTAPEIGEIHIYEPHPGLAQKLRETFPHQDHIKIWEKGLSNADYETTFYFSYAGSSEFTEMIGNKFLGKPTPVKMQDVATVMQGLGQIAGMKINIEGGEYAVLDRLIETQNIQKIDTIYVQFHEWITGSYRKRRKIRRALRHTHTCVWSYYFVWEKWVRKKEE